MANEPFVPDDFVVLLSEDGKRVTLRFSCDSDEQVLISIPRIHLASLVVEATKLLPPGSAVPIDRDSLRPGTTYSLQGYQFSPRPEHLGLTLFVDLPDQGRVVTIPLQLTPKDIEVVSEQIKRWRKQRQIGGENDDQ